MGFDPNTPVAALTAHGQFRRAVRKCEQITETASDPEIDEKRLDYEWSRWRRSAGRHAQRCKTKGYPEPEAIDDQLRELDDDWKIACDYRANRKGTKGQTSKTPAPPRRRGPKDDLFKEIEAAMIKDLQQEKLKKADLEPGGKITEEALAELYHASRDTVRRVRNKVLLEFVDNSNSDK